MREKAGVIILGKGHVNSVSKVGNIFDQAIGYAIFVCFFVWVAGILMPVMTVSKMIIVEDTYSIADFAMTLFKDEDWFILALVVLFAGVVPFLKFEHMYRVWRRYDVQGDQAQRTLKRIEMISKWSMGDVFVVAIGVVIAKTSGFFADARIEPGFYVFAGAIVGSMAISFLLSSSVRRLCNSTSSIDAPNDHGRDIP